MFHGIGRAVNSLVAVLILVTIGALGLVAIQYDPIWILLRNIALSALGEPAPGLTIEGDPAPPSMTCDKKTGRCKVED